MNKFLLLITIVLATSISYAADPDESGIGGTGVSKPDVSDFIFNKPDVPEIVEIPQVPDSDEIAPADLTDIPPTGGAANIDTPSDISVPTTPVEK